MIMAQRQRPTIGFRSVQLLKKQTLGIGSYGSVCKAICDDLLCAAKIIHPTLYDPTAQQQMANQRGENRLPIRRFEQEIEVMKAVSHPNIVQYLGVRTDPENGLSVLLMELMDESLKNFLEHAQDPLPYHIHINFCHDITRAISYLHCNEITHRDLSSNNVLLCGTVKAKVTDFGMARLGDINPHASRISYTLCPGTEVYMPPEAVKEPPVYTAKIDCFSIGVLIIQILTRKWPEPGDRLKVVPTIDPQFPGGMVSVSVAEVERRQKDISEADPNNPLLPIALECLKDRDVDRPSSHELCQWIGALKESPQYTDSVRNLETRPEQQNVANRGDEQTRNLQRQLREKTDELVRLRQEVQQKDDVIREKEQRVVVTQHENNQLRLQLSDTIREKNRRERQFELHRAQQNDHHPPTGRPLDVHVSPPSNQSIVSGGHVAGSGSVGASGGTVTSDGMQLRWRDGEMLPKSIDRNSSAVVDGDMVYVGDCGLGSSSQEIFTYNSTSKEWSTLSDSPTVHYSMAVVKGLLTIIGGHRPRNIHKQYSKLYSYTGAGTKTGTKRWQKNVYPSMPTKRSHTSALCTGKVLVVAGGKKLVGALSLMPEIVAVRTVEVMDTSNQQWSSVADLPGPMYHASITICDDHIYMLGGFDDDHGFAHNASKTVYMCSLTELFHSNSLGARLFRSLGNSKSKVWDEIAHIPNPKATCVTFQGKLLAIGGTIASSTFGTHGKSVYMYNSEGDKWEHIGDTNYPRCLCYTAVLPNNELMVIGGLLSSVEIATCV